MFVTWGDPREPGHRQERAASLDQQRRLLLRLEEQAHEAGALTDIMLSPSGEGPPELLFQVGADRAVVIWIAPDGTSFTSQHVPAGGPALPDLRRRGEHVRYAASADLVSRDRAAAAADEFYTTGGAQPGQLIWRPG